MNDIVKKLDFLFYTSNKGNIKVRVIIGEENIWASQKGISEIFGVEVNTINYHLKEIFKSAELQKDSVIRKIRITAEDEKDYLTNVYNLDAIIAVGYRVNSYRATQFRIWATKILKEYLIKGFALDDERLKQGKALFGKDYFDELVERIREIRASERRFYQKVTDLYAQCSIDYDPASSTTQKFYAVVQNKLHWAITKKTAPEIIKSRASAKKRHMGLSTWKNAPKGKVLKTDITVAKNHLTESEISELNIVVNMYLDYAELQAKKQIPMKMIDWIEKLNNFLKFNDYNILKDSGAVSRKIVDSFAEKEYKKFRVLQDKEYESDFDKIVNKIKATNKLPKETKDDNDIRTSQSPKKKQVEKKGTKFELDLTEFSNEPPEKD